MTNNYYDDILQQIKSLIAAKEIQKAQELIISELGAPYVPVKYEIQFKELQTLLRSFNVSAVDFEKTNLNELDKLFSALLKPTAFWDFNQREQFENFQLLNMHNYQTQLETFFSSKNKNTWILQGLIWEILVKQKYNYSFKVFLHFSKQYQTFNPITTIWFKNQQLFADSTNFAQAIIDKFDNTFQNVIYSYIEAYFYAFWNETLPIDNPNLIVFGAIIATYKNFNIKIPSTLIATICYTFKLNCSKLKLDIITDIYQNINTVLRR